jgi:hypothetical protein
MQKVKLILLVSLYLPLAFNCSCSEPLATVDIQPIVEEVKAQLLESSQEQTATEGSTINNNDPWPMRLMTLAPNLLFLYFLTRRRMPWLANLIEGKKEIKEGRIKNGNST